MARRSKFNVEISISPAKRFSTSNYPSKNSIFSPSHGGQITDNSSFSSSTTPKIKLLRKPTMKVTNFLTSKEEIQETDDEIAHEFLIGEMIQNKMKEHKRKKLGRRQEEGGRNKEEENWKKENAYLEEVPTNFLKNQFNYDKNFKQVFNSFLDGKVGVDSLLDIKNFPNIFEYNSKSPSCLSPRKNFETTSRGRKQKKINFDGFDTERIFPSSCSSPYLPLSSIPSLVPSNSSSIPLLPPSSSSCSFQPQNTSLRPSPFSIPPSISSNTSTSVQLTSSHSNLLASALLKEEERRKGGSFLKTITNRYDFPSAVQHFGKIKNIIKQRIILKKKIKKEAFQTNEWNVKFFQNLYSITKEYIEKIKKKDLITLNTSKNYYDKDIPTGNRLLKDFTLLNYMKNPDNQGKALEKGINNLIFKDYLKLNAESFLHLLDPKVQRQTKTKKSLISVPHLSHFLKKNIKGMEEVTPRTEGGGGEGGRGRRGSVREGEGGEVKSAIVGRKEDKEGRTEEDVKRREEIGKGEEERGKKEDGGGDKKEGEVRREEGVKRREAVRGKREKEVGWKGIIHTAKSQITEEKGLSQKNYKRISVLSLPTYKRISFAGDVGTPRTNESCGETKKDEGVKKEEVGMGKNEGGRIEEGGGRREEGDRRKEEGGVKREEGGRKEEGVSRKDEGKRERSSILQPGTSLTKRDQKLKEYINYKEDLDFFTKYKGCFQPEELIFINELSKIDILDDEYIARTLENINKEEPDLFKIFPALKAKVKYENSIREHEEKKRLKAIKQPIKPYATDRYYQIKRNNLLDESISDKGHDLSEDDTSLPSLTEATLDNLYSESLEIQKKIIRKKDSGFAPRIKQFMKLEEISSIVEETNKQKLK